LKFETLLVKNEGQNLGSTILKVTEIVTFLCFFLSSLQVLFLHLFGTVLVGGGIKIGSLSLLPIQTHIPPEVAKFNIGYIRFQAFKIVQC
jgi:hypothetical protein